MFAPFSLISSIKVQVLHPQRCPPAKPELTSDILRIRAASKLQKQKVFKLLLDITHREKKKNAGTIPLTKENYFNLL